MRRSIAAFRPTRNPRPTVCRKRIAGYAKSEPDSRTQVASAVFSIDARNDMCLPPGPHGRGLFANEVGGFVRAARACEDGSLRIRAQRPRALDLAAGHTRRNDPIGRLALLDPLLERGDRIERVGAFTAAAMAHAGDHEQADPCRRLRGAAHRFHDAGVIVDARARSHAAVAPSVIHEQPAAVTGEARQIGIDGVDRAIVGLVCGRKITRETERPPVPARVLEDDVLELIERRRDRLGPADEPGPRELGPRLQPWENLLAGPRVL